jgi:hypothetical protein
MAVTEAMQLSSEQDPTPDERRILSEVLNALRLTSHGTVTLVIQDKRVVQIDRTEKRRFPH